MVDELPGESLPDGIEVDDAAAYFGITESSDMAKLAADPEHKPLAAGWIADRVLKVVRPSPSAGQSIAYRLIVEGN